MYTVARHKSADGKRSHTGRGGKSEAPIRGAGFRERDLPNYCVDQAEERIEAAQARAQMTVFRKLTNCGLHGTSLLSI